VCSSDLNGNYICPHSGLTYELDDGLLKKQENN